MLAATATAIQKQHLAIPIHREAARSSTARDSVESSGVRIQSRALRVRGGETVSFRSSPSLLQGGKDRSPVELSRD
jgi:hypothetical protein